MRDLRDPDTASEQRSLEPVASYGHTFGLLAILCVVFVISFALQYEPAAANTGATQATQSVQAIQRRIIPGLIESLIFDWGILYYVCGGVRSRVGSLLKLSGRQWSGIGDVLKDLMIAVPFWVIWEATAFAGFTLLARLFAKPTSAHDETFPVRGVFEIAVWIAVPLVLGFANN